MDKINLHFIHGFLGSSQDWLIFKDDFKEYHCIFHSIMDYYPKKRFIEKKKNYFNEWAQNFNKSVSSFFSESKNILFAYSLGGRLALHSFCDSVLWDAAILISVHPGLVEKKERILNDKKWSLRFLNEPWEKVISDWNLQEVFCSKKNYFEKKEEDFVKKELFILLNNFSLGKQEDLRYKIKNIQFPILWISGEKDAKYSFIAREMEVLNKNIKSCLFKDTGHRVPWEDRENFVKICKKFLSHL